MLFSHRLTMVIIHVFFAITHAFNSKKLAIVEGGHLKLTLAILTLGVLGWKRFHTWVQNNLVGKVEDSGKGHGLKQFARLGHHRETSHFTFDVIFGDPPDDTQVFVVGLIELEDAHLVLQVCQSCDF